MAFCAELGQGIDIAGLEVTTLWHPVQAEVLHGERCDGQVSRGWVTTSGMWLTTVQQTFVSRVVVVATHAVANEHEWKMLSFCIRRNACILVWWLLHWSYLVWWVLHWLMIGAEAEASSIPRVQKQAVPLFVTCQDRGTESGMSWRRCRSRSQTSQRAKWQRSLMMWCTAVTQFFTSPTSPPSSKGRSHKRPTLEAALW